METSQAINTVLDRLHAAAARADAATYFDLYAPDAVFIGTDATERWPLEEFRRFAKPYFDACKGWTYVPTVRHVSMAPADDVAWFDELLKNDGYGVCRGTGVLRRVDGSWKICQYHLTIPIPNTLVGRVTGLLRSAAEQ